MGGDQLQEAYGTKEPFPKLLTAQEGVYNPRANPYVMKSDPHSAYSNKIIPPSDVPDADNQRAKLDYERLRKEQNLRMGILAASLTALAAALVWAFLSVSTGYRISYVAVVVGLLVGSSMRYFGKGLDKIFGVIGGLLTLAGCLGGILLSLVGTIAGAQSIGYLEVLSSFDGSVLVKLLVSHFRPVDFFFYGVALYEGYLFSFRKIPEQPVTPPALP
jgi:hypothetical protein